MLTKTDFFKKTTLKTQKFSESVTGPQNSLDLENLLFSTPLGTPNPHFTRVYVPETTKKCVKNIYGDYIKIENGSHQYIRILG